MQSKGVHSPEFIAVIVGVSTRGQAWRRGTLTTHTSARGPQGSPADGHAQPVSTPWPLPVLPPETPGSGES